MRTRLLIGSAAALLTALAFLLGGAFGTDPAAQTRVDPDPAAYANAGFDALQRARETSDASEYTRAERAFHKALELDPNNLYALHGLGSLALSQHRFHKALALGRRAQRLSPRTARSYGVIGDAQVELGRYPEAFRTYDRMAALKPSLASYARVSHARELIGDVPGAIDAMRLAAEGGEQGEPVAWARLQLGKLEFGRGRLAAAEREYREALSAFPGYAQALDALARVEAAHGHLTRAIALERAAV